MVNEIIMNNPHDFLELFKNIYFFKKSFNSGYLGGVYFICPSLTQEHIDKFSINSINNLMNILK